MGKLEAIDTSTLDALRKAGFDNPSQLMDAASVLEDHNELADLIGMDEQTFSRLATQQSSLLMLQGMGSVYVGLLAAVDIRTIEELSVCNPFVLHDQIKVASKHVTVGRVPNRATVEDWIEQAQACLAGQN